MHLNFEKELDPRNMRHIRFEDPVVNDKYIDTKVKKVRENWEYIKIPLQGLAFTVGFVEFFINHLETEEQTVSFYGAVFLIFLVETVYRLQKQFRTCARFGGIALFGTFAVYMAEITVANEHYKLYEGFLVLGSVEFLFTISLTVDIWVCPIAIFISHTYCFLRISMYFDKVSDVLCPGLYTPLFHFTVSTHLFNIQSKKDFILTEMHKEMTQRFITILKTFPERIVIAQKTLANNIFYPFTNDRMTEESLIKDNENYACESIIRRTNDINIYEADTHPTVLLDDESVPLDIFLEEERVKAMDSETTESESKITSIAPYHTVPQADMHRRFDQGNQDQGDQLSKKHYTVKTRQIQWKTSIDSNQEIMSFLHIFIDNTSTEKLKQEKTLREYQRMMLSSVGKPPLYVT